MPDPRRNPLLAGLTAAKANVIPGALIQATMLTLVLAYYYYAPTREALDVLAGWKRQFGYGFTFALLGFTAGVLPEILRICVFQNGTVHGHNLRDIAFGWPFWGCLGCVTDAFYRGQAIWFGTEVTALLLAKKVAVDMLLFTPLWGTPAVVIGLEWKRLGFTPRVGPLFTLGFYRTTVLPVLIANWGVWIPAVIIIYSLPLLLQIPLFALTNCFWSLLVTYMSQRSVTRLPLRPDGAH